MKLSTLSKCIRQSMMKVAITLMVKMLIVKLFNHWVHLIRATIQTSKSSIFEERPPALMFENLNLFNLS